MSDTKEILEAIRKPFPPEEIDWKVQKCGRNGDKPWAIVVPYVDARAIMNRLDDTIGPENWKQSLTPTVNGMLCNLELRVNGEWIGKMDGSDETDYEPFKGGISKALVRAAVHWGIGRELYSLETIRAKFVDENYPGSRWAKIDGKEYFWVPNTGATQNEAPAATAPAQENKPGLTVVPNSVDDLDNEVITFGKYKDKKMIEVGAGALREYYNFLKSKNPDQPDSRGMARVALYIASRTQKAASK